LSNIFMQGGKMIKPNDSIVVGDVRSFLISCNNVIVLDKKKIPIPDGIKLEIVSSVVLEYRFPNISIGNHSRFVIALGGISSIAHGVPSALHGFVQIWYTSNGDLFSHDYLETFPH
jgi:hypothetical protein